MGKNLPNRGLFWDAERGRARALSRRLCRNLPRAWENLPNPGKNSLGGRKFFNEIYRKGEREENSLYAYWGEWRNPHFS